MINKSEREKQIRVFYNAIDVSREIDFESRGSGGGGPERSLDPSAYVEDLHKDGVYLPRRVLLNAIRNNESAERYFFTGMRGSGKTTELKRLKYELEATGEFVVFYADMTEYLPLSSPIEVGDFLLVLLSALADCVNSDKRLGTDLRQTDFVERLVHFLKSEVELDGLDWSVDSFLGKLGFKFKLKQSPQFKTQLQNKSRDVIDGLVTQSRDFADSLVEYVRGRLGRELKVLFIVDSMERLRGIGDEAKKVFDSVENLFGAHRDKLRFSTLSVIYSVPPYISAVAVAGAGNLVHALPMPHIFLKPEPGGHGKEDPRGVERLVQVVEKRYGRWREFFSEAHLRRLILHTGGDLRELFLLLREVLNLIDPGEANHLPVSEEFIVQAEKLRRNQFGIIPTTDMNWLKQVVQCHKHCLPTVKEIDTLARLFDGKLLFQYRNGEDWFDVHPLLWDRVDQHVVSVAEA